MTVADSKAELFDKMANVMTGQDNETLVPILITASARALVLEADGDIDKLSTLLIKFCRLVQNEASDMLETET
jgi:hypothetical protein